MVLYGPDSYQDVFPFNGWAHAICVMFLKGMVTEMLWKCQLAFVI